MFSHICVLKSPDQSIRQDIDVLIFSIAAPLLGQTQTNYWYGWDSHHLVARWLFLLKGNTAENGHSFKI